MTRRVETRSGGEPGMTRAAAGIIALLVFSAGAGAQEVSTVDSEGDPAAAPDTVQAPHAADSAAVAAPDPEERLPFELPEVIVHGEDLSVIVGGERLGTGRPALDPAPLERPRLPEPPERRLVFRTQRPFRLAPQPPPRRPWDPFVLRLWLGTSPLAGGRLISGGASGDESAWRLETAGQWNEEPAPGLERRIARARFDRSPGLWPRSGRWSLWAEGALRRLHYDFDNVRAGGPQTFAGLAAGLNHWRRHVQIGTDLEAASFTPAEDIDESIWTVFGLDGRWDRSGRHPLLWEPTLEWDLNAGWMHQQVPGDAFRRGLGPPDGGEQWKSSGAINRLSRWGDFTRTWGAIGLGETVWRAAQTKGRLGAQLLWDGERIFGAPRAELRWHPAGSDWALWGRVDGALQVDPWWREGRARDFAVPDLGRQAAVDLPRLGGGIELAAQDWRWSAELATARRRSPRTWRPDSLTGLHLPATSAGRWIVTGSVAVHAPPEGAVTMDLDAGFLEDGKGEALALRPAVWAAAALGWRAGAFTFGLDLEAAGPAPLAAGGDLPGFLIVNLEAGRRIGAWGRVWLRAENVGDRAARRWPFAPSSQRILRLGWDFGRSAFYDRPLR
ncbi:MAG: hypothetical protein GF355_12675 [Candidatus Eisenbacteria bacterium]|nr:hypothetical protein [Candidatus Eisenbacteria bacterium]